MKFMIWKECPNYGPRVYLVGGKVWSTNKQKARLYTLHGVKCAMTKLEKTWCIDPNKPRRYGWKYVEGA